MRDTILLHSQHLKQLDKLSDEQAGKLLKSLYALMTDADPEPMDGITDMLFSIMKEWTLNNWTSYDTKSEARREAGRKGGLAKGSNAKFATDENSKNSNAKFAKASESKNSNAKHNDNDNDNENDNDNDNGNDNRDEWTLPYGTYLNVLITMDEYDALCESWKKEQVDEKVEHLSSYLKQGHEYKNHYVALRDWLKKDYPEQRKTIGSDHMERAMNMIRIASNE